MATNTTKTTVSKPSFASIAAMAPPTPSGQHPSKRENEKPLLTSPPKRLGKAVGVESPSAQQLHRELQSSMSRLSVKDPALASNPLNDQQKSNITRAGLRFDDDQTQISSSSTKAASLDGKSATSGTTFAMDEKESLRPDDSASVKAAEDDEFGSGPASGAQNSRVGSEAGSRAFRDQFYEITENIGSAPPRQQVQSRRIITGIEEEGPQLTHAPHVSALPAPANVPPPQLVTTDGPSIEYNYQEPDEKLFEALESPKDRLFLLRLEQEVITFIRDPAEPPMIDLPPCNSFCRLLAHKLADYYALTHFVDNAVSSVRLYRTPYCRLRAPLGALAAGPTPVDATASSQPAMKIMRRAGLGKENQNTNSGVNTRDGSMAPSKAGSEIGYDSQQGTGVASPTDSIIAKDKSAMTREEREAKYKETRDRIFGPESENADSSEAVNEVSRTSSRNEKKKKKHKNNDDGFTARSQYNVYYPSMPFSSTNYEQNGDSAAYYSPYAMQPQATLPQNGFMGAAILQQGFQQGFQQGYQSLGNPQAFQSAMTGNSMMNGYEMQNPVGYQQLPQNYYTQTQQGLSMGIGQQSPAMSSPALSSSGQFPGPQPPMSDQQWTQNNYAYPFQQPRDQQQYASPQLQNQTAMAGMQSVPYQFGQLPMQPGLHGAKAQHPLPGSYKSQSFNPQTRAFVPHGGSVPPQPMHQGTSPNPAMSRSPAMSYQNGNQYTGYNSQQVPFYPQMASMPVPSTYNFGHEPKTHGTRKSSAHSNATQSPVQSSLSKWGTPAHLPPKPPPPETPSVPEGQHSLPMNNQFNVNVQPMSGGQPMPSFQNGVYSIPVASSQPT